jgi:hypothetical protein
MSSFTIAPAWDEQSKRAEAQSMLQGYAAAAASDAGAGPDSIVGFVDPRYAADHSFYLLVVPMLSRCFPGVAPAQARVLGLAFYGIFRMVLAMDRVVDRGQSGYLFDGLVHYTVGTRRLAGIFPGQPRVWSGLTERIRQSVDQIERERELRCDGSTPLREFVAVAEGKSSLIQLTVDWLDAISPVGGLADRLRGSLLNKHLGMQWLDDINDFVVDVEGGQATWARARLHEFARANGLRLEGEPAERQKRLLFASGLGEELLGEASAHFAAALAELGDVEIPEYAGIIRAYIEEIERIRGRLATERASATARVAAKKSASGACA